MKIDLELLLDELVRRHARGEPLDVEGLLREAGQHANELGVLIDRFLEQAVRQEPSEDALEYVRALDDPPLLNLRREQRLMVDDVVDAIVRVCQLPASSRGKVRRYYQMLEAGTLDPQGVAVRLWDALADMFGRRVETLARAESVPPGGIAAQAMYRRAEPLVSADEFAPSPALGAESESSDEVDALFLGGAD